MHLLHMGLQLLLLIALHLLHVLLVLLDLLQHVLHLQVLHHLHLLHLLIEGSLSGHAGSFHTRLKLLLCLLDLSHVLGHLILHVGEHLGLLFVGRVQLGLIGLDFISLDFLAFLPLLLGKVDLCQLIRQVLDPVCLNDFLSLFCFFQLLFDAFLGWCRGRCGGRHSAFRLLHGGRQDDLQRLSSFCVKKWFRGRLHFGELLLASLRKSILSGRLFPISSFIGRRWGCGRRGRTG